MPTLLDHCARDWTPPWRTATGAICLFWLCCIGQLHAQQRITAMQLNAIYPAGAKAGTQIEVEITAQQQLEGADRLVFSHPGITAKPLMREPDRFYPERRPVENKFIVTVDATVPIGIYEVRAGGKYGLSTARRFAVGHLPEVLEVEDNNVPERAVACSAPVALNGISENAQVDYFRLQLTGGETSIIEGFSERLDARGDLALELYDANHKLLARALHKPGRDPAIPFTPASSGDFWLRVHEASYNNLPQAIASPYRVLVHQGPWIEAIDPPLAQRGKTSKFTLYGWNLGPDAQSTTFAGRQIQRIDVEIELPAHGEIAEDVPQEPLQASLDWFTYRHKVRGETGNPVQIALADGALRAEQEPNDASPQILSLPAEVHGRFDRPNDVDRYSFTATEGSELWIEIDAQRLGQPVDPLLVVERVIDRDGMEPQIQELTTQDDLPPPFPQMLGRLASLDAAWLLKVPATGTYRVLVRDQFNSGGQGLAASYRLRIRPPQPGFRLLALPGIGDTANGLQQQPGPRSCAIPSGGADELLIVALRQEGFDGAITVSPQQLPAGISAAPVVLGPGETAGTILVRAAPGAKLPVGTARFSGRATIAGAERSVPVMALEQIWNIDNQYGFPGRLTERIVLSIDESLPTIGRFELAEQKVWRMARGGKLELPFKFLRQRDDFTGQVTAGLINLPENNRLRAQPINLSHASPSGKLELDIQQDATVGRFSFIVRGEGEVDYRRNLELAEQASADKQRIEQVAKQINEALQQSQRDRQQADQALSQSQQQRGQAEQIRNQALQRMQQATEAEKQAAQRVAQAKEQLAAAEKRVTETKALVDAAADDSARRQAEAQLSQSQQQRQQVQMQLTQFEKQHAESAAQLKQSVETLSKSEADFKAAEQRQVEAQEKRTQAVAAEQQAQADVQLAQRMQQEINSRVNQRNNVARQQKLRVSAYSEPLTVEIVPYPVVLQFASTELTATAGQTVDLVARLQREFNFDGEVVFQLQQQPGGVRFQQDDRIKSAQNEARLPVLVDKNVPPGEHKFTLIARMQFNGRGLELREQLQLTILPAPPEAK